jgi:hypothetical protein
VIPTANQASDLAAADAETVLCDLERGEELRHTSAPPTRSYSPPAPAGATASGGSSDRHKPVRM